MGSKDRKEHSNAFSYRTDITLILVTLLPGMVATAQDDPQAFPQDVVAEIQTAMDDLTAGGLPPGMIAWIDAPEYQFAGASGFANAADNSPMPPDGAFRIGSITKMFTAAVIIQLAENGVLTLDDPLALWLPDVADQLPYGDQITLRHLLTHTSGVFHYVDHEAYYADLFTAMNVDEATGVVTLDCAEQNPNDTLTRYVYGQQANLSLVQAGATAIPITPCSAWSSKRRRCRSRRRITATSTNRWE